VSGIVRAALPAESDRFVVIEASAGYLIRLEVDP
jgi:hypothetical protein